MTCSERTREIVGSARNRALLTRELEAHLADCAECQERWQAESQLTAHLAAMRMQANAMMPSPALRESLMHEFGRRQRRTALPAWAWSIAAAAAIVVAIFIGHAAGRRTRHTARTIPTDSVVMYEVSADATALSNEDFVEVPYTPPLAPGEMVRVVHTEMHPETLASMGVAVDPAWTDDLPVDMVVGEDGLPRAVRISETTNF